MTDLWLNLETELPESLPADQGSAVFLFGTCFHRHAAITGLEILVDGDAHPVTAFRMPRFDLYRSLHPGLGDGRKEPVPASDPVSAEDPGVRSYRSGFWATAPIPPSTSPVVVAVRAGLDDGSHETAEVGRIGIDGPPEPEVVGGREGRIVICMATFNPDVDLLRVQLDSLRQQTDDNWICLVSDDCSSPERFRAIEEAIAGDGRFVLSRSERRLGVYRSFERALGLIPLDASLVALCDQDDRWYPEKLATLRAGLGDAKLIYSDQRLVDEAGEVLADTYWSTRGNNHTNLESLLIANTITGAASLMSREVVGHALPFPEVPGEQYHDHWLGLVAMTLGEVAYVDRPLYDYVQHRGATLGHAAANAGIGRRRMPLREAVDLGHIRRMLAEGPGAYFHAYERLQVLAATLLQRCATVVPGRKRRALTRFIRAERSPLALLRLRLRPLRALVGRNETLGIERLLVKGILWRHALNVRSRGVERPSGWTYDASMPPWSDSAPASAHRDAEVTHIQRIMRPLLLSVSATEPERVNLLIPTVDLKHLFGGYIAKFNLALRLASAGRRVRIVAVDPTPPLPSDWREQVESYSGLGGALSKLEIVFADDRATPLPINPDDLFIATTWWTAHVARAAVQETSHERFLYLVQEYEPFTFEMGSLAALAMQSYEFPHVALFSTELLRTFFAKYGHGVFAGGREAGEQDSVSFRNAITPVRAPTIDLLSESRPRRLLFYARAEPHARRNMFELGLIALSEAVAQGVFGSGWEYSGIGSVSGRSRIGLPDGADLQMLSRLGQHEYGELLGGYDVGLSLMFTPHPSLVPLEMASAGMLTVTNTYDTKTATALQAISPNLIATGPSVEGVVAGLRAAVSRVDDLEARVAGAAVDWPDTWEDSFSAGVIHEVNELLKRC